MTLVATLARETGLSVKDVRRLTATAPRRYKIFAIPKRDGSERLIAQPAFEIKALQRVLLRVALGNLPVHEAAHAYVKGKSIRTNALAHASSHFILKLDFKNFFYSIRPVDLEQVLRVHKITNVSPLDYENLYNLVFWGGGGYDPRCLSIGAPSSPMISNVVMYEVDVGATQAAAELGLVYTRYADDMTVSGNSPSALEAFEARIAKIVERSNLNITFNQEKRGLYGRGVRRMVTGLILTPDGNVSIGRDRKREIRAAVHQVSLQQADDRQIARCQGLLAFVISAEPSFLRSLRRSYGAEVIRQILKAPRKSFYVGD